MKRRKWLFMILCLIFSNIILFTFCTKKETEYETESEEVPRAGDNEQEIKLLNFHDFTELEVVTDCAKFTAVTQDQSYCFETDMNPSCIPEKRITDAENIVYMSQAESGLFAFQKETASADIACNKPDCKHDVNTIGGECQANLRVLNAEIGGIQYYSGDFYYTLADGASILYKMSSNHEIKSSYTTLLGKKESGRCGGWLIHRGYIYFYVEKDGLYRMPVDNPLNKELLIHTSKSGISLKYLFAEGSYVYFAILENYPSFAAGRYNIETNQIEQFMGMERPDTNMLVHDGKIYYMGYSEESEGEVIYQYDVAEEKNKIFFQREDDKNLTTDFWLLHADSDYIYIRKHVYGRTDDYYNGNQELFESDSYLAYTWDGAAVGEILNTEKYYDNSYNPLDIFSREKAELVGSDSDRIYYLSKKWDVQVQENGILEKVVEGTEKSVISYINKSEISAQAPAPVHIAGEIYD